MDILNAIFTLGPIGVAGYAWIVKPLMRRHAMSSGEGEEVVESKSEHRTPRTDDVNAGSARQDAAFSSVQSFTERSEPEEIDPPNADELRMLGTAIRHNATGATKQQAIEISFGVRKGGSAGWRRASLLFDLATAPPLDPFPILRAQRSARWEPSDLEQSKGA